MWRACWTTTLNMILPYISGIGIRPHFDFCQYRMWVWCMSGGVCLCLGFLGIPWDSITQIFPILVPRLFWYQIILYDTVFEAFSRLQIFPICTTKKWKFPLPVCHTVARVELNDPSVEDILKDWAACAERMKPQPRLSVIRANVNLKLEENLVRNHRNAMTPQDSLGISKIKLYLHDGPVYRWYNWYKNYLPGDDGTLRRV